MAIWTEEDVTADPSYLRVAAVLDEEPDLAEDLEPEALELARRALRARVVRVDKGRWDFRGADEATFGFLVLRGLFVRRIRVATAASVELLGPGDLLRPWEKPFGLGMLPPVDEFRVIAPGELAVLDTRFLAGMCRWPPVVLAFSNRLLRRARNLSFQMATGNFTKVEDRVLYALWHMADNWGRVTPEGIVVPFRLTHEMLGDIVGAQRPSVSTAMTRLERAGRLARREDRCYVLLGDPPDLATVRPQAVEVES